VNAERSAVAGVGIVILLTAVVFGPLVAGISLSEPPKSQVSEKQGDITIESVTFPAEATIESASYGAANHHVNIPAASVQIQSLSGAPILAYELTIASIGVKLSTAHFLDEGNSSRYELTMEPATLNRESLDEEYTGEAAVVAIDSSGRRTVAKQTVTVRWA
jgi:hypothetical protein